MIWDLGIRISDFISTPNLKSQIPNRTGGKGGIRTHGKLVWYTAFPVLPVQPLLHLSRFRICDCGMRISRSANYLNEILSPSIQNPKLKWRRGWDSNPRYPSGYNDFRDRPIQPLSHLSASEVKRQKVKGKIKKFQNHFCPFTFYFLLL